MKYRKRPLEVLAYQWLGVSKDLPRWLANEFSVDNAELTHDGCCLIHTLEGDLLCLKGDWIIKGIKGEIYPIADDIFKATYEPVD